MEWYVWVCACLLQAVPLIMCRSAGCCACLGGSSIYVLSAPSVSGPWSYQASFEYQSTVCVAVTLPLSCYFVVVGGVANGVTVSAHVFDLVPGRHWEQPDTV